MARYRPSDPIDMISILDFINRAKTEGFDVDLKKYYRGRSNPQNRFLHMALGMFANKYGCSLAIAKEVFLKQYACPHIFRVDLKDKDGNDITYYRSTADLNTVEMSNVIRNFIDWAGCQGVEIPEPDDDKSVRYCEREIEKTAAYGT